jgi:hypothetical protein
MAEAVALGVGIRLKELVCRDKVWQDVTVQHSDAIGVVFEVQRTVAEGGTIETVVSQILVPWASITYIVLMEERM